MNRGVSTSVAVVITAIVVGAAVGSAVLLATPEKVREVTRTVTVTTTTPITVTTTATAIHTATVTTTVSPPSPTQGIVEAARKEGKLVIYRGEPTAKLWEELVKAFQLKYPFISVEVEFLVGLTGPERIISEAEAKRDRADITDTIGSTHDLFVKQGLLLKYAPPEAVPPAYLITSPEGYGFVWLITPVGFTYNTKLVKAEEAPKTYRDLLHPRWKGQIATFDIKTGPAFPTTWYGLMKEVLGIEYFYALAQQDLRFRSVSSGAMANLVATGEEKLAVPKNLAVIPPLIQKGSPIAWVLPSPGMVLLTSISILKNAPHPNAAKLWLDFMATKEAATIIAKFRLGTRTDIEYINKEFNSMASRIQEVVQLPEPVALLEKTEVIKAEMEKVLVLKQRLS